MILIHFFLNDWTFKMWIKLKFYPQIFVKGIRIFLAFWFSWSHLQHLLSTGMSGYRRKFQHSWQYFYMCEVNCFRGRYNTTNGVSWHPVSRWKPLSYIHSVYPSYWSLVLGLGNMGATNRILDSGIMLSVFEADM